MKVIKEETLEGMKMKTTKKKWNERKYKNEMKENVKRLAFHIRSDISTKFTCF